MSDKPYPVGSKVYFTGHPTLTDYADLDTDEKLKVLYNHPVVVHKIYITMLYKCIDLTGRIILAEHDELSLTRAPDA